MHTVLPGSRPPNIPEGLKPKLKAAAAKLGRFTVHQLQTKSGVGRSMVLRFVSTACIGSGLTGGVSAYELRPIESRERTQ